jgi:hypothetical protein
MKGITISRQDVDRCFERCDISDKDASIIIDMVNETDENDMQFFALLIQSHISNPTIGHYIFIGFLIGLRTGEMNMYHQILLSNDTFNNEN